jgi:hypothetical protein
MKRVLLIVEFRAVAVFWTQADSTPIVTAKLAKIAILARMLFRASLLFFRNINFPL